MMRIFPTTEEQAAEKKQREAQDAKGPDDDATSQPQETGESKLKLHLDVLSEKLAICVLGQILSQNSSILRRLLLHASVVRIYNCRVDAIVKNGSRVLILSGFCSLMFPWVSMCVDPVSCRWLLDRRLTCVLLFRGIWIACKNELRTKTTRSRRARSRALE